MNEKINIELGEVQKTLLLPLLGRAVETKKPNPLMRNPAAVRIIDEINYDFTTIIQNISYIIQLAWIANNRKEVFCN